MKKEVKILDVAHAPGKKGETARAGQLRHYRHALMQRHGLDENSVPRLKEALRRGNYSITGGDAARGNTQFFATKRGNTRGITKANFSH